MNIEIQAVSNDKKIGSEVVRNGEEKLIYGIFSAKAEANSAQVTIVKDTKIKNSDKAKIVNITENNFYRVYSAENVIINKCKINYFIIIIIADNEIQFSQKDIDEKVDY